MPIALLAGPPAGAGPTSDAGGGSGSHPTPVYPLEVDCPRAREEPGGRVLDLKIPAPAGTSVLAIASGSVVGAGAGGRVVLRHRRADTALDTVVYSVYAPLEARPGLGAGARVRRGQSIGRLTGPGPVGGEVSLRLATYLAAPPPAEHRGGSPPRALPPGVRPVHPLLVLSGRLDPPPSPHVPVPYHVPFERHLSDRNDGPFVWPLACAPLADRRRRTGPRAAPGPTPPAR